MGFFRNPEQSATLDNFITLLALTALRDFHTREFDNTATLSLVSIINQFGNDLIIDQFGTGGSLEREALTTLSL